ncbi:hypothetical protein EIN_313110 [Entamoeba invadens IP1]|uniref:Uncharacterized protein n=1 Tax=Entamoeba invadens IP1 TaxID=370355 RepID=A0A0A1UCG1_ENTIV|nr:hypothetical protein EIN_313080 [Entamoeba invadens IP1]XP_004259700.1 hypothetical protein EIN_313110 [Entamoeba invadens IP1]ELP92926.1 hypothetical protein EIN_313080 [Entamoeba invadens IP1]ELP92929.1 hypothetical protein EIN_313110 [Entamoeba invadens IP1]|eukprot:XP_004259697.1 hypothetical protein EIN_313080 [Entamoeba invadens IP1]
MNVEHDAVIENDNGIEIPHWTKFSEKTVPMEDDSEEEKTDNETYTDLHTHFEQNERRRYVMLTLNPDDNDKPFVLPLASMQYLKMTEAKELKESYTHNFNFSAAKQKDDKLKLAFQSVWETQDAGQFALNFKISTL